MSLVHSLLTYGSPVWWSYCLNDTNTLERIQHYTTKYILNDYINNYNSRLINLNILLLMYTHEIADVLFFIRNSTSSFNINNYSTFYTDSSHLAKAHKLQTSYDANNIYRHFRTLTEFLVCGIHYW